jgi:alkanesulfonate monooxygenase SsuD/methylene tetrahydromethanopterin reductase-like flavin-dependent oxidoreductase (luciferase family)
MTGESRRELFMGVALDGAGWHPGAWREEDARPADLFSAGYWTDLARIAEAAGLDFLTLEDSLALQSSRATRHDDRVDLVRGRLDAVMIAARVAPMTQRIGLIPTVIVTHTEPFHISKAIATLDYMSGGRAGVRVQVSGRLHEAAHFGRRANVESDDLFEEAAEYVEVVRRLWDSWEDDAEIRDVATGRFVDREKLHYIEFTGRWFNVKGPSITPRPPQAQPPVVALAHSTVPYRFAAAHADLALVTPMDADDVRWILDELDTRRDIRVLADVVVFLGPSQSEAEQRKLRLDELFGHSYRSDAFVYVGTAAGLADLVGEWAGSGIDGFRLRPGGLPHDLVAIADGLMPRLRERGMFPSNPRSGTLRDRFGWARPANRYAVNATVTP